MGSNMQRQAVPLIKTESPIVGTGMEHRTARDSGVCVIAKESGVVEKVTANEIVVRTDKGQKSVYRLLKYKRSNQGTCINQRPIVKKGDRIEAGDILADGPSTQNGELALGKNVLVGFMPWKVITMRTLFLFQKSLSVMMYIHQSILKNMRQSPVTQN